MVRFWDAAVIWFHEPLKEFSLLGVCLCRALLDLMPSGRSSKAFAMGLPDVLRSKLDQIIDLCCALRGWPAGCSGLDWGGAQKVNRRGRDRPALPYTVVHILKGVGG